jgi:hypothetical protein
MKRTLISWAVGVALLAAALLPVVFHAQPGSPRPGAPAATPAAAASPAPQHHPRIEAAIQNLEAARRELQAAPAEFHGHRVKAIEHVDRALQECHKALEVGP